MLVKEKKREPANIYYIDMNIDRKKILKEYYQNIIIEKSWRDLELWAGILLCEYTTIPNPYFIHSQRKDSTEYDIVFFKDDNQIVIVEAKLWKNPVDTQVIDNLVGKMLKYNNCNIAFLVTTKILTGTKGAIGSIKEHLSKGKIIVPIQGPDIERFLNSDETIREFVGRLVQTTQLDIEMLNYSKQKGNKREVN